MYRSKIALALFICFSVLSSCKGGTFDFSIGKILILSNGDEASAAAANYLYSHLDKRNINRQGFEVRRSDEKIKSPLEGIIYLEVVPDLEYDYEIVNKEGELSIFGKDIAILKWLSYMLIDQLANFHQIEVADLPPNYIDFSSSKVNNAFSYREPHLRPNLDQDISGILNTHNVDRDWGLWGHNLKRVFPNQSIPLASQAFVNGKRDSDQYCFSAESTFLAIKSFILDQYGDGTADRKWFMIAPNDNDLVCTCASCLKLGNTNKNGTAAVVDLLNRLGREFPKHHFFTTAYRTTKEAPSVPLLGNVGVLLSTIDLNKAPKLSTGDQSVTIFSSMVKEWGKRTSAIYIWDYISNFDDYLTPFPVLYRVQEQLKFFKNLGVQGVFLNGSGYDYAPFDDVKTYVLSAVMSNPNLDVPTLVKKYYERFYPISEKILTAYFLDLEKETYSKNTNLGVYIPFRDAVNMYFDADKFTRFYKDLIGIQGKLTGSEKEKIDQLVSALSYTQLQVAYHKGTIENGFLELKDGKIKLSSANDNTIARLKDGIDRNIVVKYKEDNGDLSTYLKEWEAWKREEVQVSKLNTAKVKGLTSGDYLENSTLLFDCKPGFQSDFNQGWFLAAEDIKIEALVAKNNRPVKELQMAFLINNRHRMLAPEKIEIWSDNGLIAQYSADDLVRSGSLAKLKKSINISDANKLEIKIFKNKELKNSVIACDEIQLY